MDYQRMIWVGNTTKDAEVKQPEGKMAYADFTLAVSRTKELKTFFPVRVFGKLAETCDEIKKGAKVLVEGELDISEYTNEEGQKKMTFRVLADTYRCSKDKGEAFKVCPWLLLCVSDSEWG